MRNVLGIAALSVVMAGCATTTTVDGALTGHPGVNIRTDSSGSPFLDSVEFTKAGHDVGDDALPLCVTKVVRNSSVTLSGSTSNYVSPWTGIAYNDSDSSESSGGQVLEYVAEDGHEVVASGTSNYRITVMGMPIQKFIRYTVNAKVSDTQSGYWFENLTQAQGDTGVVQNNGFMPVAAWEAANPEQAYLALSEVAEKLDSCLASR